MREIVAMLGWLWRFGALVSVLLLALFYWDPPFPNRLHEKTYKTGLVFTGILQASEGCFLQI